MWIIRKGTAFNMDNMKGITTIPGRDGFVYVAEDEFDFITELMKMNLDMKSRLAIVDLDKSMRIMREKC